LQKVDKKPNKLNYLPTQQVVLNGINRFTKTTNSKLPLNDQYIICVETYFQRENRLLKKYPFLIAQIYFFLDFVFKRIFQKLILTRKLYFFLSKAEAIGRLVFNGFDIVEVKEIGNLTYFACKKTEREIPNKIRSLVFYLK